LRLTGSSDITFDEFARYLRVCRDHCAMPASSRGARGTGGWRRSSVRRWFREFTFPDLEAACRDVWAGAILTTASNVPFFATQGGKSIGASFAINAMLRAMTGRRARVLGKPSPGALRCALRRMGLAASAARHTLVVGDDPALEMRMARSAGALAIAVTTGLNDRASFDSVGPAEAPDAVLDDLAPLVALLS
jgi:ribonucleotide monophosphatase NagD (HAD superfamily)